MTDQKGEELAGKGFRIRGSLPPGSVTLAWTFDLQRAGSAAKIPINQPWRTYTYRVISEAPRGLKLRVSDFPESERIAGRRSRAAVHAAAALRRATRRSPRSPIRIRRHSRARSRALDRGGTRAARGRARALPARSSERRRRTSERALLWRRARSELIALAKQTDSEHARARSARSSAPSACSEIATELALVLRDEETLGARKAAAAADRRASPHRVTPRVHRGLSPACIWCAALRRPCKAVHSREARA